MASYSAQAAEWACTLRYEDLPEDVVAASRLRVLDMLGLVLAAVPTPFGLGMRATALALSGGAPGAARILGGGECVAPLWAAFANGAMAQALQFDDTHSESVVHPTSPNLAVALALCEAAGLGGRDLIAAMAVGIELGCRIGVVAPSQFLRRGMHPTAIVGALSSTFVAARLLGLTPADTTRAVGHAGSFASGIVECWSDGTDTQYVHPGWAAHSGIAAATLAAHGVAGPSAALEGRYGLFPSHIQDRSVHFDFDRMLSGLGSRWESRRISFKPYPTAHTVHAFLDALLWLHRHEGLRWESVKRIVVRIAAFMIPLYCEPLAERLRPRTAAQARVSVQYSLAEALYHGRLGGDAYAEGSLRNPEILALAEKIEYAIDPDAPGTERFKGWVVVETTDGRRLERIEEHNRGSAENPMSRDELLDKFHDNAGRCLPVGRAGDIVAAVDRLEDLPDVRALVSRCVT